MIKGESNSKVRLYTSILFGLILLVLSFITLGSGVKIINSPQLCTKCHELNPQIALWQASAHSKIACTKCHQGVGLKDKFQGLGYNLWNLSAHFTKFYQRPLSVPEGRKVTNETCLQCHTLNREISPSGDLIIPHDRHQEQGISCIKCHIGVTHGNVTERGLAIPENDHSWTLESVKAQLDLKTTVVRMNACLSCHQTKKVTTACEACHQSIRVSPEHKSPSWPKEHGQSALREQASCNTCHSNTLVGDIKAISNSRDYPKLNVFCAQCHTEKKPQNHQAEWRFSHGASAKSNKAGCLTCHTDSKVAKKQLVAKTNCATCHEDVHPKAWLKVHPSQVKQQGTVTASGSCYSCHKPQSCSTCHQRQVNLIN